MSDKVLTVYLVPLGADQSRVNTPIRVYYCTSTGTNAPQAFSAQDPCWQFKQSDSDYRKTNRLLNGVQQIPVAGTPLLRFVMYDNISMWQFLPSYLWPAFHLAVELIDILQPLVQELTPSEIRFFDGVHHTDPIWRGVVQAIGEAFNLLVSQVPVEGPFGMGLVLAKVRTRLRADGYNVLLSSLLNRTLGVGIQAASLLKQGSDQGSTAGGKKLLFATFARHWTPIPGKPGQWYDEQVFPLLDQLRSTGWSCFVGIDCPYASVATVGRKLWHRVSNQQPGVRWRAFYSARVHNRNRATTAAFRRQWQSLQGDEGFADRLRYRGIRLLPSLRTELRRAFLRLLPACAHMLNVAERLLEEEKPDALMATYETGPFQRALIIRANAKRIPTIGLMHGMIFDNHYDYMHANISKDAIANPYGFVVPNMTCVWGSVWSRSLVESGHYPPEVVRITGNWRYDHFAGEASAVDMKSLRNRFRVPDGARVVLILSANQSIAEFVRHSLEVVASRTDCVPLIKLHPADDPAPIRALLKEMGYPPDILLSDQLLEALRVSDLVISQISTVVSEAVLLDRPVVLVNFQRLVGWDAYISSGICLYATTVEELSHAVGRALDDAVARAAMGNARSQFIAEYYFATDGRAAERVVSGLNELVSRGC